ncbi:MAG TPA: hypothetical protein VI233_15925 [Puia sp.]
MNDTLSNLKDTIWSNGHELRYWIDHVEADEYTLKLSGWGLVTGIHSWTMTCKIDFKGARYSFSCKPHRVSRNDVTIDHGGSKFNYDYSGFHIEVPRQAVGQDCYDIYLTFRDKDTNELVLSYPVLSTRIV